MSNNISVFQPDAIYHLYNRANGKEKLFLTADNYMFFLKKYQQYIYPIADTFCYCLMPNHFHFLVRIKSESVLKKVFREKIEKRNLQGFQNLGGLISQLISKQFSNFFNSYTKAFNKQQSRNGSLFSQNFKRKQVKDEKYMRKLIHYIHYNPIAAGITHQYDWKYSSYPAIISSKPTRIKKEEVIIYFDDLKNFLFCHQRPPEESGIDEVFKT